MIVNVKRDPIPNAGGRIEHGNDVVPFEYAVRIHPDPGFQVVARGHFCERDVPAVIGHTALIEIDGMEIVVIRGHTRNGYRSAGSGADAGEGIVLKPIGCARAASDGDAFWQREGTVAIL